MSDRPYFLWDVDVTESGVDLDQAFTDARRKDGGADPATLAWLLEEVRRAGPPQ